MRHEGGGSYTSRGGRDGVKHAQWLASRQRSSTTREYIGAADVIEDLRAGRGEFATPQAFYDYWRAFPFRISQQVQRQLDRLIREQRDRIAELERRQDERKDDEEL